MDKKDLPEGVKLGMSCKLPKSPVSHKARHRMY